MLLPAGVVVSAFLLFLIQPLIAKQVLPWFGGTAAVWAVCLVFYQVLLLGGYLYAHGLARWLAPRYQALVHAALLLASLAALPIGLEGLGRPAVATTDPSGQVLWLLLRAVGLPYFLLSTTSPLLQHWAAQLDPAGRVYRLFGWSNLACALALLSFPFALEPWLSNSLLNHVWSLGYALEVVLLIAVSFQAARQSNTGAAHPAAGSAEKVTWSRRLQWLALSALGSALLLGVTNHLCQAVAPIPFLWTVPLLLYLLTFVAVFEREWYGRPWLRPLASGCLLALAAATTFFKASGPMLFLGVPLFSLAFFGVCLFVHGELAHRKPAPARLTEFYILMAAGGALGSVMITFGAPRVFTGYYEFPVLLMVAALLLALTAPPPLWSVRRPAFAVLATVTAVSCFGIYMQSALPIASGRNFYGSLRVIDQPAQPGDPVLRQILHGPIIHGLQWREPDGGRRPTSYYGPQSAPWRLLSAPSGPRRIGVAGLGAGALASFLRAGDHMVFYEINPHVERIARAYFRFLPDAPAPVEVRLGDARLLLESEAPQQYDYLFLDVFTGDSIPSHLLTREAFALYAKHLKPGGLLAFHITNKYLDLEPVVRRLARESGAAAVLVAGAADPARAYFRSRWVIAGPPGELAARGLPSPAGSPVRTARLWTDDYSSLLTALK